jgi:Protein of unknown function (DUF3616)
MPVIADDKIILGYTGAKGKKLLANLSGIAATGDFLWTVSDEGRTLECLRRDGEGYGLARQVRLDEIFPGLPDRAEEAELDLESVDIADGALWLAGSHCNVRVKPLNQDVEGAPPELNSDIKERASRTLLGRIELTDGGGAPGAARALPFGGDAGSLRAHLLQDPFLKPFVNLPSKENGLDIEGLAIMGGAAFLGLRGPLIDSYAAAVEVTFDGAFQVSGSHLHFLDLGGGLGIRDLARDGDGFLVIAGPVADATSPFRLLRWTPRRTPAVQKADIVFEWPAGNEKPEGLCVMERGGERGAVILYDSPDGSRIAGKTYSADWLPLG